MIRKWISNSSFLEEAVAIKDQSGKGKTSLIKEGIRKIRGRGFALVAVGSASDSNVLNVHTKVVYRVKSS